ncbi:hypothetical protein JW933_06830 [candidate division FCPU426 bacterium]|nr:hypothetical protein [candidate division FCPU426 bacterium]
MQNEGLWKKIIGDECAQAAAEYVLISAVLAAAMAGALAAWKSILATYLDRISGELAKTR